VSVRNPDEALVAVRGGADIIDVKEPANGALGRASFSVIRSIAETLAAHSASVTSFSIGGCGDAAPGIAISVALGEVREWLNCAASKDNDERSFLGAVRPQYLKLGLAGLCPGGETSSAWTDSWKRIRDQFSGHHSWVAVAYADHVRSDSPCVEDVCSAAAKSGCRVLLIDTFEKDGSNLLDFLTASQLGRIKSRTSDAGMQLALAGRITERQLPILLPLEPEIIAVRGAVCEAGFRTAAISEAKVRSFVAAMDAETLVM